mmetsp:Transcript_12181/g.18178  ORF Transcript_12181/g.18178 Transcript_12181/m.18178 type:complete len:387 (-) Transcript_12181:98-1258(-)
MWPEKLAEAQKTPNVVDHAKAIAEWLCNNIHRLDMTVEVLSIVSIILKDIGEIEALTSYGRAICSKILEQGLDSVVLKPLASDGQGSATSALNILLYVLNETKASEIQSTTLSSILQVLRMLFSKRVETTGNCQGDSISDLNNDENSQHQISLLVCSRLICLSFEKEEAPEEKNKFWSTIEMQIDVLLLGLLGIEKLSPKSIDGSALFVEMFCENDERLSTMLLHMLRISNFVEQNLEKEIKNVVEQKISMAEGKNVLEKVACVEEFQKIQSFTKLFSPHLIMHRLLRFLGFDVSVPLDWLLSGEIKFIEYLMDYGKYTKSSKSKPLVILGRDACTTVWLTIDALGTRLSKLHQKKLFPYNIQPLINTLFGISEAFEKSLNAEVGP